MLCSTVKKTNKPQSSTHKKTKLKISTNGKKQEIVTQDQKRKKKQFIDSDPLMTQLK